LVFLGLVPLLLSSDIILKNYTFDYKNYFKLISSNKNKSSKKAFAYEGLNTILTLHLWPIIVFILLNKSFFNLGVLLTIISFVSLIFVLYFKAYFDKNNKNKILRKIVKISSLNWFFKSIVIFFGLFFLFVIEGISRLTQNLFGMLFMSIFYNNAKKIGYMDYIILRELYLHSAKIIFGSAIILLFLFFGQNLFILSGIVFSGVFISFGLGYLKEEI
jgi:hypothetical protein